VLSTCVISAKICASRRAETSYGFLVKTLLLVLNLLGFCIFAFFSWLQHEDSNTLIYENAGVLDMWSWIAFYAVVSVACLLAALKRFPLWLYILGIAYCAFELVTTAPGLIQNLTSEGGFDMTKSGMNPNAPQVEQSREFFGAVIALAAIGFLMWQRRWFRRSQS